MIQRWQQAGSSSTVFKFNFVSAVYPVARIVGINYISGFIPLNTVYETEEYIAYIPTKRNAPAGTLAILQFNSHWRARLNLQPP